MMGAQVAILGSTVGTTASSNLILFYANNYRLFYNYNGSSTFTFLLAVSSSCQSFGSALTVLPPDSAESIII